jgi:hypothetical protein
MDPPRSQNLPDHGYALFHSHMLALDGASNFIEHFDCTFIVGDKQSLQSLFKIIDTSRPRPTLQCRVSSNFVYKIVDDVTHDYSPLYGVLHNRTLNEINGCIPDRACAGRSKGAAVPTAERRLGWRTMMRQRSAVSFTFVVALLWANVALAGSINAEDIRVIDGDTLRVFQKKPNVRLVGFNAPETRRAQCEAERELGAKATRRVTV